ncbi:MAG: HAD hydrolase family protein [Terrisporobacter sp.]|uniref:HAD family hydrolase n=1 Tax=Terrisporobacter sp. TaxID=1965305 RepID=UPI002FC6F0BB
MKNYKLIVTDMDGTVLGGDHKLTEENMRALKEAEKRGVKVIFATGRFHDSAKAMMIEFI